MLLRLTFHTWKVFKKLNKNILATFSQLIHKRTLKDSTLLWFEIDVEWIRLNIFSSIRIHQVAKRIILLLRYFNTADGYSGRLYSTFSNFQHKRNKFALPNETLNKLNNSGEPPNVLSDDWAQVPFFLQPSAKDQGITWVVVVLVLVLVLVHLVHFLFERNLSEKKYPGWESNRGPSALYPLSYRVIDIINVKIDLYILPQTLYQYWSTLVSPVTSTERLPGK